MVETPMKVYMKDGRQYNDVISMRVIGTMVELSFDDKFFVIVPVVDIKEALGVAR